MRREHDRRPRGRSPARGDRRDADRGVVRRRPPKTLLRVQRRPRRLRRPGPDADESEINLEITGRDAGRIIGKKGMVLSALQFIVHRVVNRPGQDRRHVLVDAEGYRSRRDDSLATMAKRLGKQAVEQGKIITFEPMNPRDRRVVHLALAKFEGVITKSDGEGDDRRVQIIPVRR